MSPGALYRYFPSKESMIEAIVEKDKADAALFLAELAQAENKAKGIAQLMARAVLFLAKDRRNCQLSVEVSAEAARNPEVARLFASTDAIIISTLIQEIEKGQAAGQIDPNLHPKTMAQQMVMMIDGFVGRLAIMTDWDVEAIAQQTEVAVFKLLSS